MADNGGSQPGSETVKIEIYDQSYNVNADGNEDYLRELAAYVDGKMRSVADATKMVDSLKVAVLAALNIADEMFTLRRGRTPSKARCASEWKNAWHWWKRRSSTRTDSHDFRGTSRAQPIWIPARLLYDCGRRFPWDSLKWRKEKQFESWLCRWRCWRCSCWPRRSAVSGIITPELRTRTAPSAI